MNLSRLEEKIDALREIQDIKLSHISAILEERNKIALEWQHRIEATIEANAKGVETNRRSYDRVYAVAMTLSAIVSIVGSVGISLIRLVMGI